MPICKPNELIAAISPGQRLLGLDVGKKTIGLALSDRGLKIATADNILRRSKFTKDAIILFDLIDREEIGGLVIGWPLNM
ncbi:MAG: RuvX/YqgF family protein, partial [Candidatus Puniceispirillum sp.]